MYWNKEFITNSQEVFTLQQKHLLNAVKSAKKEDPLAVFLNTEEEKKQQELVNKVKASFYKSKLL